jgi:hypothetical protein
MKSQNFELEEFLVPEALGLARQIGPSVIIELDYLEPVKDQGGLRQMSGHSPAISRRHNSGHRLEAHLLVSLKAEAVIKQRGGQVRVLLLIDLPGRLEETAGPLICQNLRLNRMNLIFLIIF